MIETRHIITDRPVYDEHGRIRTDSIAADLLIECGEGKTLVLNNAVYKDMDFDLSVQSSGGSVPALIAVNGDAYIVSRGWAGTGATVEQLGGAKEMPHETMLGLDIVPHIHWAPTTADIGNVKWQLRIMLVDRAGVYGGATTLSVVTQTPGIAWAGVRSDFPPISTAGISAGARILFTLFRNPADVQDTYGFTVITPSFGIHIPVDTLGTRTVTDK